MDSLTLADGTVIDKVDGSILSSQDDEYIEVPSHTQIQRDIVSARKRLTDLPLPPNKMNSVSVILVYSVMGVSEEDIATVMHIDESIVRNIKMSDVYSSLKQEFIDNLVKTDLDNVRNLFIDGSHHAAHKMIELSQSNNAATALAASKDILDRAGHRPSDVVEHRHKVEGGLTIEIVERTTDDDIPTIDVTPDLI